MAELVPAYEGNNPYLFISYAHKDSEQVLKVVNELFTKKYRIWYDEGIAPGSEWPKNIAEHLIGATGVIAFVSKSSLASPNCENEAVRAIELKKDLYQFNLDDSSHKKLEKSTSKQISSCADLISLLPDSYIGDGTGYDRLIGKKKNVALWNILIGVAAAIAITIGTGLFGLNNGWFDSYLPGLNQEAKSSVEAQDNEAVTIDNDILANAMAAQAGRTDLNEELSFTDSKYSESFFNAINRSADEKTTYGNISSMDINDIFLENANDETINCLSYMSNLESIRIASGEISSLSPLLQCPKLKSIYLNQSIFPVDIPENSLFDVYIY